jgi:hypothetical protein
LFAKIEPSGCCVRKGTVQIRICFYLEPTDFGYDIHHIQVPDFTGQVYSGEVGTLGNPVVPIAYQAWVDTLPKVWQVNPFHNHFIYVAADAQKNDIKQAMKDYLKEFWDIWSSGKEISKEYKEKVKFVKGSEDAINLLACEAKVSELKSKEVKV